MGPAVAPKREKGELIFQAKVQPAARCLAQSVEERGSADDFLLKRTSNKARAQKAAVGPKPAPSTKDVPKSGGGRKRKVDLVRRS